MNTVIKVENLSKKYIINHNMQTSYETFSEKLVLKSQNMVRHLFYPFSKTLNENELEEFWALKDINFEIKQGDKVGIIGRNGAGKSTLLKVLSKITSPTTGKVTLEGKVASLLEVGTGFHPELTGRENIFLNGSVLGMRKSEIKNKFDEIVTFAEVEKFLDTPVKRYSSGMYVRLAFAVAAHLEPEILIIDEVLAVGDNQFQKKCLGKMEDIGKEGRTVLFVSHNIGMIESLCSRAIYLKTGHIEMDSDVAETVNCYINDISNLNRLADTNTVKNRKVQIISLTFISKNQQPIQSIRCGDYLSIKIQYQIYKSLTNPIFRLTFYASDGTAVTHFDSKENNFFVKSNQQKSLNTIFCVIEEFLLLQGEYIVNVGIEDEFSTVEHIIGVARLVIDGVNEKLNYYSYKQNIGHVHLKNSWVVGDI